jgi:hypothetical protein
MAKVNPIQLQKSLKGVKYPASKADLVKAAKENGADENIRTALNGLADEPFNRPSDVSKAVREGAS